jgi:HSP20 family protein
MALIKRERAWPLEPVTLTDDWVDRVFRDMFRDFFSGRVLFERVFDGCALIRLEQFVDGETCVIRAELPGIDPEKDVEITVSDGVLHLKARREGKTEERTPASYRSEFHYGSFERAIRLPEGATSADVKASYKDGILEVCVPVAKPVTETATRIPITHD